MCLFVEMAQRSPTSFFVDDSLLFCQARMGDVEKIQELLGKYEQASGQNINSNKSTLFFSNNASFATKEEVKKSIWGARN